MKQINLDQLLNPEKKRKNQKILLTFYANLPKEERVNRKERDPKETELLAKAIMAKLERYQREGVLVKNGRQWRFYF